MIANLFSGERVRLTSPRVEDAATMSRWYENGEFGRLWDSSAAYPRPEPAIRKWIEGLADEKDTYAFAIRLLDYDEMIGYLDLSEIQWTHRTSWLAIAIGSAEHRGKGYGAEAMELALKFAFHEINLHRVQLTVFSYNDRAIRLYERLGFQREGVYREFLLRDGQRYDMILYGLLCREWEAQRS